jgi:hypothetical protein
MSLYPPFYPPQYPTAAPAPTVPEALAVNGVDLASYAYMTSDISSLLTVPARRGDNAVVPARHGRIQTGGKKFDANDVVLPLWLVGALPDGSIPADSTERAEFFKRRDELLRLFYADAVTLQFTRSTGTVTTTRAEVADVVDFTRVGDAPVARVSIALTLLDAFWEEPVDRVQVITGATGTTAQLQAFAEATAPMADLHVRFFGPVSNPRLAVGDRWVQYNGVIAAGRELVLDAGTWTASIGSSATWVPNVRQVYREPGPAWFELDPAEPLNATFTHTGGGSASVEISGRRKYLAP